MIAADIMSDHQVANPTERAAFSIGAKPMIISHATPLGLGEVADSMLPKEALTEILEKADAWVELKSYIV